MPESDKRRLTVRRIVLLIAVAAAMMATPGTAFAQGAQGNPSCFDDSASAAPGPQAAPGPVIGDTARVLAQSGILDEFTPVGIQALQELKVCER